MERLACQSPPSPTLVATRIEQYGFNTIYRCDDGHERTECAKTHLNVQHNTVKRKHQVMIILVVLAAFIAVGIFAVRSSMRAQVRPMFHDRHFANDREIRAGWKPNPPVADANGTWMWLDATDNILVIQEKEPTTVGEGGRNTFAETCAVFDQGLARECVVTKDDRDHIVICSANGRVVALGPLAPDLASQLYQQSRRRQEPATIVQILMKNSSLGPEIRDQLSELLK